MTHWRKNSGAGDRDVGTRHASYKEGINRIMRSDEELWLQTFQIFPMVPWAYSQ